VKDADNPDNFLDESIKYLNISFTKNLNFLMNNVPTENSDVSRKFIIQNKRSRKRERRHD
jgi:hypothetical protein